MEFILHFLGGKSVGLYLAAIVFIVLGFVTNKVIVFRNRTDKTKDFSWSFWLKDNWADVVLALLLSFTTVRFTDDILNLVGKYTTFDVTFITDAMFYYYIVGLTHQTLLHLARKKFTFLTTDKKDEEKKE